MIARKFVPLRDFSSCEFTPLKESKCKILHPRRSCITPLNVPYSVFWHAYHRKFTADYAFGARLSSREPCDLGAVRLAAAIALASPMFRLDGGQSSTLPSFSPIAGVHSSGLNKRLHLAAKTSDRHRQKPAVISAPLFSCSGARGCIFEGHKKPRRPERHIGTRCGTVYVPDRRYLGSSMLPLSRLVDGVTVVNASLSATHLGLYGIRR